jgi:hypothetical protein
MNYLITLQIEDCGRYFHTVFTLDADAAWELGDKIGYLISPDGDYYVQDVTLLN